MFKLSIPYKGDLTLDIELVQYEARQNTAIGTVDVGIKVEFFAYKKMGVHEFKKTGRNKDLISLSDLADMLSMDEIAEAIRLEAVKRELLA